MRKLVAIVDYGAGNLYSVARAVRHVSKHEVIVTASQCDIQSADAIVFPGQGAARQCMKALHDSGLIETICQVAQSKPFLGVCMGMQVLLEHLREDGGIAGLGLIKGEVCALHTKRFKIPHMGWNKVTMLDHPLWHGLESGSYFYFVHSYYVQPTHESVVRGICDYDQLFCCALAQDNLFAMQAHPEKSGEVGLRLLRNFTDSV